MHSKVILFLLLIPYLNVAQWYNQNSGTTSGLSKISFFANDSIGFASGGSWPNGTILYTSDGGKNWLTRTLPGTSNDPIVINSIYRLTDRSSAVIIGKFGLMKKTTDAGLTWHDLSNDPRYENFTDAYFFTDTKAYAVDDQGYFFRTTNGGKNWNKSSSNFGATRIEAMAMYTNINMGYVAGKYGKVFHTTDDGLSWKDVSVPNGLLLWLTDIECITTNNFLPSIVLVSGYETALNGKYYGVIYKSTDYGKNWKLVKKTNAPINKIKRINNITHDVFAVGNEGQILISYDDGDSWYFQNNPTNIGLYDIDYRYENQIYLVGSQGTILVSNNSGGPLSKPNIPSLYSPMNQLINLPTALSFSWSSVKNADTYHIQLAKDNLFSNIIANDSLLIDTLKQFSNLSVNSIYWWRVRSKNISGTGNWSNINTFSTYSGFNITTISNPLTGGLTTGGGTFSSGTITVSAHSNPGYIFTDWRENGSIVSNDSNYTFQVISSRTLTANFSVKSNTKIPTTGLTLFLPLDGTGDDLSQSFNNGQLFNTTIGVNRFGKPNSCIFVNGYSSYVTTSKSVTNPYPVNISIWFKTTTVKGGWIIGFGQNQFSLSYTHDRNLYMTTDGKLIWGVWSGNRDYLKTLESFNDGKWHHIIASIQNNGMYLYVDGKLNTSNNAYRVAENFSGYWKIGYESLDYWPETPSSFYFNGTLDDIRIYNRELSNEEISLLFNESTVTSVTPSSTIIPDDYSLFQNYPNPFNPTTIIRFSIPSRSMANIKIYDLMGREIRTLINEELSPGNYEINFDGSELASGIYFYKLQTAINSITKKMILMK